MSCVILEIDARNQIPNPLDTFMHNIQRMAKMSTERPADPVLTTDSVNPPIFVHPNVTSLLHLTFLKMPKSTKLATERCWANFPVQHGKSEFEV